MQKWRYTALVEKDGGDLVEIARFATRDLAELFLQTARKEYSDLHIDLEDMYRERTMTDLLNGELEY